MYLPINGKTINLFNLDSEIKKNCWLAWYLRTNTWWGTENRDKICVSRLLHLSAENVKMCCRLSMQRGNHTNHVCRLYIKHRTMCWNYYVTLSWRDNMFVKILLLVCVWQPDKVWSKLTFIEPCITDVFLTLTLLTWSISWAPNNASKWQMAFNSAFRGLSTTNEMQCYTVFFIVVSALRVSSSFSAHHQELKNYTCSIGFLSDMCCYSTRLILTIM
jgi:hypothetical protein